MMRALAVLLVVLAVAGSGCMACAVERAETWDQPSLWDWSAAPGAGVTVLKNGLPEGPLPWPSPPDAWRGNHTVIEARHAMGDGFVGLVPNGVDNIAVTAVFPSGMKAADRAAAVRTAMLGATNATPDKAEEVARYLVAKDPIPGSGGGRFLAAQPLSFDLEGLAASGGWEETLAGPYDRRLVHGPWWVDILLEKRTLGEGEGEPQVVVDAGGHVHGPWIMEPADADERRHATAALLARWGAPAPTYEGAKTETHSYCS